MHPDNAGPLLRQNAYAFGYAEEDQSYSDDALYRMVQGVKRAISAWSNAK